MSKWWRPHDATGLTVLEDLSNFRFVRAIERRASGLVRRNLEYGRVVAFTTFDKKARRKRLEVVQYLFYVGTNDFDAYSATGAGDPPNWQARILDSWPIEAADPRDILSQFSADEITEVYDSPEKPWPIS